MFGSNVVQTVSTIGSSYRGERQTTKRFTTLVRRCSATYQIAVAKGFGEPTEKLVETVDQKSVLPPVPHLQGKDVRANWNATALAFLGDSVWELYVRRHFFFPPSRLTTYYDGVSAEVRAESQERYYELLLSGQFITEEEREILRWGRNAKVNVPPRFKASGKHAETYKHATAVECLAGYLYLTNPGRLHELMLYLGLGGNIS